MELVKHIYSKRVYEVVRDHGENHPYLKHLYFLRMVSQDKLKRFFRPCGEQEIIPKRISIDQEILWEKRFLNRNKRLKVYPPKKS